MFSKKFSLKKADLIQSITYYSEKDIYSNQNIENYIKSFVIPNYEKNKINEALNLMKDTVIKDE